MFVVGDAEAIRHGACSVREVRSGLNVGPGERFFIEYIGRQSTSEADDGQRGPHEGCTANR